MFVECTALFGSGTSGQMANPLCRPIHKVDDIDKLHCKTSLLHDLYAAAYGEKPASSTWYPSLSSFDPVHLCQSSAKDEAARKRYNDVLEDHVQDFLWQKRQHEGTYAAWDVDDLPGYPTYDRSSEIGMINWAHWQIARA